MENQWCEIENCAYAGLSNNTSFTKEEHKKMIAKNQAMVFPSVFNGNTFVCVEMTNNDSGRKYILACGNEDSWLNVRYEFKIRKRWTTDKLSIGAAINTAKQGNFAGVCFIFNQDMIWLDIDELKSMDKSNEISKFIIALVRGIPLDATNENGKTCLVVAEDEATMSVFARQILSNTPQALNHIEYLPSTRRQIYNMVCGDSNWDGIVVVDRHNSTTMIGRDCLEEWAESFNSSDSKLIQKPHDKNKDDEYVVFCCGDTWFTYQYDDSKLHPFVVGTSESALREFVEWYSNKTGNNYSGFYYEKRSKRQIYNHLLHGKEVNTLLLVDEDGEIETPDHESWSAETMRLSDMVNSVCSIIKRYSNGRLDAQESCDIMLDISQDLFFEMYYALQDRKCGSNVHMSDDSGKRVSALSFCDDSNDIIDIFGAYNEMLRLALKNDIKRIEKEQENLEKGIVDSDIRKKSKQYFVAIDNGDWVKYHAKMCDVIIVGSNIEEIVSVVEFLKVKGNQISPNVRYETISPEQIVEYWQKHNGKLPSTVIVAEDSELKEVSIEAIAHQIDKRDESQCQQYREEQQEEQWDAIENCVYANIKPGTRLTIGEHKKLIAKNGALVFPRLVDKTEATWVKIKKDQNDDHYYVCACSDKETWVGLYEYFKMKQSWRAKQMSISDTIELVRQNHYYGVVFVCGHDTFWLTVNDLLEIEKNSRDQIDERHDNSVVSDKNTNQIVYQGQSENELTNILISSGGVDWLNQDVYNSKNPKGTIIVGEAMQNTWIAQRKGFMGWNVQIADVEMNDEKKGNHF